jgi:hypothetical protein
MSYSTGEFRDLLDAILPAETFREGGAGSGKAVWLHSGNLWILGYEAEISAVRVVNVKDGMNLVDATLFRDGVGNIEALLKAIGALS